MNWESLCRNADRLLFQQLTINQQNQQERDGAATPKEENMTKIQAAKIEELKKNFTGGRPPSV